MNMSVTDKWNPLQYISNFKHVAWKIQIVEKGHIDTWHRQDDHRREKKGKCNMYENPFWFIIIKYDNWYRKKHFLHHD